MKESNEDVRKVVSIANKASYTSMTATQLIDELGILAKQYPNDHTFGLLVRSIIYNTQQNLT